MKTQESENETMPTQKTVEFWSSVAEIIAAIGVIVTLGYLAVGISGNTTTLKSQTQRTRTT